MGSAKNEQAGQEVRRCGECANLREEFTRPQAKRLYMCGRDGIRTYEYVPGCGNWRKREDEQGMNGNPGVEVRVIAAEPTGINGELKVLYARAANLDSVVTELSDILTGQRKEACKNMHSVDLRDPLAMTVVERLAGVSERITESAERLKELKERVYNTLGGARLLE